MDSEGHAGPLVSLRPQSVMLSFLAIHVLNRDIAVFSGSIIDVFARIGVSEEAVRSTLTRMVNRDLLARHRQGRRMYFGLTPRSKAILQEGYDRIWLSGAVNRDWDGTWTMVTFSIPDALRSRRHDLRSHLMWAGFGMLQNGVWIAPGARDMPAVLAGLQLDDYLRVFTARAAKHTEDSELVQAAFDVDEIAARYEAFLGRWDRARPLPDLPDDLARQLMLHTDWLNLARSDPRLPLERLPRDWPAIRAERLFRDLATAYKTPAAKIAAAVLETITR